METDYRTMPFHHAVIANVLPSEMVDNILTQLDREAWTSAAASDYRFDVADSRNIEGMISGSCTREFLTENIRKTFPVKEWAAMGLQRYKQNSRISPHSDNGSDEVRVVINFNRQWSVRDGGIWVLSCNQALSEPRRCLAPLSNTGFVFFPGPKTFHALTKFDGLVSYALIISFTIGNYSV